MPNLSRRRKQLQRELCALGDETMMLEQLDGLIAGLLVCPDLISPGEWLPLIWSENADRQSPFVDVDHANFVFSLIMDHYNDVVLTLMKRPERYRPLFPVGKDEILWEVWIEGFLRVVRLRPEAWEKLLNADAQTSDAMLGMLALIEIVCRNKDIPQELVDDLTRCAPDLIPRWVVTLNNWRLANAGRGPVIDPARTPPFAPAGRVTRNAPCPCGSGKKYKKCCGLN